MIIQKKFHKNHLVFKYVSSTLLSLAADMSYASRDPKLADSELSKALKEEDARGSSVFAKNSEDVEEKSDASRDETRAFKVLVDFLEQNKASFKVVMHAAEGQCDKVAALRGSTLKQSAKAIIIGASISKKLKQYYMLVLRADQQVDFDKVKSAVNAKSVRMADREVAESLTGCVMGSIPPFSFNSDLKLIVDPGVKVLDTEIVFNAGSLQHSIFLKNSDYLRIVDPIFQDISK